MCTPRLALAQAWRGVHKVLPRVVIRCCYQAITCRCNSLRRSGLLRCAGCSWAASGRTGPQHAHRWLEWTGHWVHHCTLLTTSPTLLHAPSAVAAQKEACKAYFNEAQAQRTLPAGTLKPDSIRESALALVHWPLGREAYGCQWQEKEKERK